MLDDYIREIGSLNERYDGSLRVLAGVEIDTNPERCALQEFPIDRLNRLDLVLFEFVNDEWNGGSSLAEIAPLIDRIKVPCGLVHTDFKTLRRTWKDSASWYRGVIRKNTVA